MKIDPRHLINLLAIATHGSFNRAAAALGISQPALSNSIAQLERRLGVTVLDRSRRGSEINEFGRILLQGARVLEAVLAQSADQLRLTRLGIEGPLRIGATPSMTLKFMPEFMAALLKSQGALDITLVEGLDDELVGALRAGGLDLVFGTALGSALPGDLVEESLFDDPFAIGVGLKHELRQRKSLTLAELRDYPWVLPGPGSAYRRYVEALFLTAGIPWPQDHVVSNSLQLVESIVALSNRVTIVTRMQVVRHNFWRLRAIPLRGAGRRSLSVKWRRMAQLSPLGTRIVELAHSARL